MSFSKDAAYEHLRKAHEAGRLAHAYLLTGPLGCGKAWLADRLAALTLECPLDRVPTHPDAHILQPGSRSRRIVIEQIRELEQSIQRKPLVARAKVVIIHDADRMQPQAANAFLKTLEEPPANSLILLLSSLPEALLETVLSRCVETPLHGGPVRESSEEETAILRALDECLARPIRPGVTEGFRFTRAIRDILAELRTKIGSEFDKSLREDVAHYKQASDGSSWLSERAEQVKALAEASVLRERERILQIISDALGNALRAQHGHQAADPTVNALAEKFQTADLLGRLNALETLRRRLALGVNEALALESGFLEMISGGCRGNS